MESDLPLTIYANNLQCHLSLFDFELVFRRMRDGAEQPQELVVVVMSPQHAKSVSLLLARMVAHYEAQFGPLPDTEKMKAAGMKMN